MNMIKRALSLTLVCLMMLTLLCACGDKSDDRAAKQEELCSGKWLAHEQDSEEQALILLENIDLYEEEIALADLGSLKYSSIIEFNADGTYRHYISVPHTKAHVREFYEGVFEDLYENRGMISEIYETDLSDFTEEEFQSFYALLYGYESFSELMDEFVEYAYEYDWEDLETGTYSLKTAKVLSVERVSTDPEAESSGTVPFRISNGTLTLEYSDGAITYTNIG